MTPAAYLVRVTTDFACFGLVVVGGVVTGAAPIARRWVGMRGRDAVGYWRRRGGDGHLAADGTGGNGVDGMSPMRKSDYPPNWNDMSKAARERAGQRCEQCGVANGAVGARDRHGVWHDEYEIEHVNSTEGAFMFGCMYPKIIRIVLTCHHPNGDRANPNAVLEVLCQLHHLAKDRPRHIAKAREMRRRKRGQIAMEIPA